MQWKFFERIVLPASQHTTSVGEMIAAFAKENNLATIAGITIAGRLLSGSVFKVDHSYTPGLPVAAYLTWQESVLQGKGVFPSKTVELPYQALREQRARKWITPSNLSMAREEKTAASLR